MRLIIKKYYLFIYCEIYRKSIYAPPKILLTANTNFYIRNKKINKQNV